MIPAEELRKDPDWSKWVGVQEVSVMDSGNGVLLSSTSLVAYLDGIWSISVGFVIILSVVTTMTNSFIVYPIVSESVPIPIFFLFTSRNRRVDENTARMPTGLIPMWKGMFPKAGQRIVQPPQSTSKGHIQGNVLILPSPKTQMQTSH